ncbi:MAG: hypothetical protein NT016_01730 [Candidatus Aenigmarchaeota archaeon]|nr:hypothetical protein [Candidatus Aenigmarchaeota archaeon]
MASWLSTQRGWFNLIMDVLVLAAILYVSLVLEPEWRACATASQPLPQNCAIVCGPKAQTHAASPSALV